jgi:metal-responsive CopG/Arc/MetJ family transcriptional regulator
MATKSISIPAQLHQELKSLALWEGKTLKEMVTQLLKEGLERERAKQERLLREYYEEVATTSEYKEMVEDFLRATAEILPDDEWPEFQDE